MFQIQNTTRRIPILKQKKSLEEEILREIKQEPTKKNEAQKNEFVPSTESAQNYYDDHDKKKKDLKKGRIQDRGFKKANRNR